jgi:DNA-binding GntR family transcriptional regulator
MTSEKTGIRQSMADRVKHELLSRIMDGRMPPGSRIIELQIAQEMQTSQGPVREAFRELEATNPHHARLKTPMTFALFWSS